MPSLQSSTLTGNTTELITFITHFTFLTYDEFFRFNSLGGLRFFTQKPLVLVVIN